MDNIYKIEMPLKYLWVYSLLICLFGVSLPLAAQHLIVSAPSHVVAGENFRIAYTANTQDIEEFRSGNFPTGLEVIAGPYTSSQSSFQMVNGHTSSSSSVTYTYTVYAGRSGNYTIPAAHAIIRGRKVTSKTVSITVTGQANNTNRQPKMHEDGEERPRMRSAGTAISSNDLLIKVSANKRRVYEQEPILLTYKVYTLVDLTQLEGKMPDLTGFHTQEVKLPQQKTFHKESLNGKVYNCVTWSQYVMYPQMTGQLEIPAITFKGVVVQQNRNVDPFEAFFNGGSGYVEVKKNIQAPGLTIQVDPLPKRPIKFSGGVGHFNISASVDKREVKVGNPITVRVVIGGIGNLKLIKQPEIEIPKGFDKYDAKITDKTRLSTSGVEGNMIYDFLAVPHHQGDYTIPSIPFTYFDVSSNTYKTIATKALVLHVDRGNGEDDTNKQYTSEANDIRPLMDINDRTSTWNNNFFGSPMYWCCLLLFFFIFASTIYVFRKRALYRSDVVRLRSNKAQKIANKRLRIARQLMLAGKNGEFYDEVLRTLWGYVSDKLNIPIVKLSRENIQEQLEQRQVAESTINNFLSALDECEYERYAPGDAIGNMNKTFDAAMTAIMDIENKMKSHDK